MKKTFEGIYLKHQGGGRTLALIPGQSGDGAFIQVITGERSYNVPYPPEDYRQGDFLRVGDSVFSKSGCALNIQSDQLTLKGRLGYTGFTPIKGDIMGPFRFFPMECRHSVISMRHGVQGSVTLNGDAMRFDGATGYIEGDRGRSFPESYAWVQCNAFDGDCSLVASVARIPLAGMRFWGSICVVLLKGREYRLATYKGAVIECCRRGRMVLCQGKYRLEITVETTCGHHLFAPEAGAMSRMIHESAACPVQVRFTSDGEVLFQGSSEGASYEYAMGS